MTKEKYITDKTQLLGLLSSVYFASKTNSCNDKGRSRVEDCRRRRE